MNKSKNETASSAATVVEPRLYWCVSCGFLSTKRNAYKVRNGKIVCLDCDSDFGLDANVTRWMEQAGAA